MDSALFQQHIHARSVQPFSEDNIDLLALTGKLTATSAIASSEVTTLQAHMDEWVCSPDKCASWLPQPCGFC
jgi:hypothetical protein